MMRQESLSSIDANQYANAMQIHFADRLAEAVRRKKTALCVGLDPRWDALPIDLCKSFGHDLAGMAQAFEAFCIKVLALVAPHCGVVKPQMAFFEMCGPPGLVALQRVIRAAQDLDLLVILDAKRGDIASTAIAYADAAFAGTPMGGMRHAVWDADALTINPYLGRDAVEPFLQVARIDGRGLFVLVRTSNPGAGLFQDLDCGGNKLYEAVGDAVAEWAGENVGCCGFGDVGAVVGATHPAELKLLRERLPNVWFLVPGYGAQGGTVADVRNAMRGDGLGAIVNSSRGVTFPFQPEDPKWEEKIVEAVKRGALELRISRNDSQ